MGNNNNDRWRKGKDYHILEELCQQFGPSGRETLQIQPYFARLMNPLVDKVFADNVGNCYAHLEGKGEKRPHIMIGGHGDCVGFMVKSIDEKGNIFTEDLTGFDSIDYRTLPHTRVLIEGRHAAQNGKLIQGVFNAPKPLHKIRSEAEMEESIRRIDLAIDIGAKSREQAKRLVNIGDYVAWCPPEPSYQRLDRETRIVMANLDDRLGLFCIYRLAKSLKKARIKNRPPITFVSTAGEETWIGSARVAARVIEPDISLTMDVSAASDQIVDDADFEVYKQHGKTCLNDGPIIARGKGVQEEVFDALERICTGKEKVRPSDRPIKHQVSLGGSWDGAAENEQIICSGNGGIKSGLIGVATRNTHSNGEIASLSDVERTIDLVGRFIRYVGQGRFSMEYDFITALNEKKS